MSVYRASPPANQSARESHVNWGVYDSRAARMVSEQIYTQSFARKLAAAMNYAYEEGRKSVKA